MKKRLFTLALALALCLGLHTPAFAYDMGKAGTRNVISAGEDDSAAVDKNGTLWTWGWPEYDALGRPGSYDPAKVLDNVVSVSYGSAHAVAIKTDGTLWTWGNNSDGELGNGTMGNSQVPVKVLDNAAAVSCGNTHTAAIKTDGSLWMWGDNNNGQLGNGRQGNATNNFGMLIQTVPVKVMDNVAAVSCGNTHTAAIKTDGTLWMWGSNSSGELGNGTTKNSLVPVKVMDGVAAVSCGNDFTAAIKTDGSLWTWGHNDHGQLGNGHQGNATDSYETPYQTVPVKVMDNVAAVSCGFRFTAAIKTDGTLWTWGDNDYGQLGNGGQGNDTYAYGGAIQTVPVKVMDNVAAVSCGYNHTMAVKTDGSLWVWGSNNNYMLGDRETGNATTGGIPIQTVPIQFTGLTSPFGVRLHLNGGTGGGQLWTNADGTITVPTNPTKAGYTFGGWYTDEALTKPWNFNDKVTGGLLLYAKWVPVSSSAATTGQSSQTITLNSKVITLDAYTLIADNGGDVTYVKLRDVAALLENTGAKFNVDWRNGAIYVSTKTPYTTKNGTELKPISGTDGSYRWNTAPVLIDGVTTALEGIVITDGQGGGHTFFKLRDLGEAIGFTVDWSRERGIYIETD